MGHFCFFLFFILARFAVVSFSCLREDGSHSYGLRFFLFFLTTTLRLYDTRGLDDKLTYLGTPLLDARHLNRPALVPPRKYVIINYHVWLHYHIWILFCLPFLFFCPSSNFTRRRAPAIHMVLMHSLAALDENQTEQNSRREEGADGRVSNNALALCWSGLALAALA